MHDDQIDRVLRDQVRSQKDKPYVWGGTGPTGYDCTGFVNALLHGSPAYAERMRREHPWRWRWYLIRQRAGRRVDVWRHKLAERIAP